MTSNTLGLEDFQKEGMELFFMDEYNKRHAMSDPDLFSIVRKIPAVANQFKDIPARTYIAIKSKYDELVSIIEQKKQTILEQNEQSIFEQMINSTGIETLIGVDFAKKGELQKLLNIIPKNLENLASSINKKNMFMKFPTSDIIKNLQYHDFYKNYISKEPKEVQTVFKGLDRYTLLAEYPKFAPVCEELMDEPTTSFIRDFFLVTLKYDFFISDLLSPLEIDDNQINSKDIVEYIKTLKITPIFLSNNLDKKDDAYITLDQASKQKKFLYLAHHNNARDFSKVFTPNFSKQIFKKLTQHNKFRIDSTVSRLRGLWLWDMCKSPLNTNKINIKEAIEILRDNGSYELDDSPFYRLVANTEECIQARCIIPLD